jgi:hypothetical protein
VVVVQQQLADRATQVMLVSVEQMAVLVLSMFVMHSVRRQQQKSILLSQHLRARVALPDIE